MLKTKNQNKQKSKPPNPHQNGIGDEKKKAYVDGGMSKVLYKNQLKKIPVAKSGTPWITK